MDQTSDISWYLLAVPMGAAAGRVDYVLAELLHIMVSQHPVLQLPGETWKKGLTCAAGGNHDFDGWQETQSWQSHRDV